MWRHADLKVQGKYYLQLWAQLNLNILDKISSFLKKTNKPIHYQKLKEKGGRDNQYNEGKFKVIRFDFESNCLNYLIALRSLTVTRGEMGRWVGKVPSRCGPRFSSDPLPLCTGCWGRAKGRRPGLHVQAGIQVRNYHQVWATAAEEVSF